MAYIRKFKTASGATGVQVCWKEGRKVVRTEHIGSATTEQGIARLEKKARGVINAGKQPLFDFSEFEI